MYLRFASSVVLIALAAAAAAPAIAEEAPVVRNRSIGYVVTHRDWAIYMTPEGKTECPHGINQFGPREQFRAMYPDNGAKRTYLDTAMKFEGDVWFPGSANDPSPLPDAEGTISYGLNLDGKIGAHDFTSPDGEKGIDNQLYRAIGCVSMYRESFMTKYMQDYNFNRVVIELTGVDNLTNDDNVVLTSYRGLDSLMIDASGNEILPRGTQRVDERFGKVFIQRFPGKIKNGVLETEPGDVAFPETYGLQDVSVQPMRGLRWRLKLTPDSAEGTVAGYVGVDDFYRHLQMALPTHYQSYYQLSALSLYASLSRLADGYPDPKTGKNTALSSALLMKMKQVFIQHPAQETATDDPARRDGRPTKTANAAR